MKRGTEKNLRCPVCKKGSILLISVNIENNFEIREGTLKCDDCGKTFTIQSGIPHMFWELPSKVQNEKSQWEIFAESEGWLNPPDEYLNLLPSPDALKYVPKDTIRWLNHQNCFNSAIKMTDFQGKKILDLGAGRCWSTKLLTLMGSESYAMDVLTHPKIGLGAADVLMSRNSIFFERIAGDMTNIPFVDGFFDVVFITGSLHHTLDLEKTISEICRVLRGNGRLIMVNEACGCVFTLHETCEMKGKQLGINEHNYRVTRFLFALNKGGFHAIKIIETPIDIDRYKKIIGGKAIIALINRHPNILFLTLFLMGGVLNIRAFKKEKKL